GDEGKGSGVVCRLVIREDIAKIPPAKLVDGFTLFEQIVWANQCVGEIALQWRCSACEIRSKIRNRLRLPDPVRGRSDQRGPVHPIQGRERMARILDLDPETVGLLFARLQLRPKSHCRAGPIPVQRLAFSRTRRVNTVGKSSEDSQANDVFVDADRLGKLLP